MKRKENKLTVLQRVELQWTQELNIQHTDIHKKLLCQEDLNVFVPSSTAGRKNNNDNYLGLFSQN